jgi:uncharacterized protein YbaP (TraB family)
MRELAAPIQVAGISPALERTSMKALLAASLLALAPAATHAQSAAAMPADDIRDEAPVVVQGVLPGPGLWKVEKDGHVMWVLGTQSPLPRRMQWRSHEVEAALAASQEILYAPTLGLTVETGGFFRSLVLVPKLYGARRNPDDKSLRDVLPADLYARWLPLRKRYLGSGRKVERMRPLFAADLLWMEALDDNGLVRDGIVGPVLARAVKAHGLRETRPGTTIKVTDPKALLAEAEHAQLEDTVCMRMTIERLEAGTDRLRLRANAWATGDVDMLRALPDASQDRECTLAAFDSPMLRKRGGADIVRELESSWLDAAEAALARNASTFAMLPISDLLSADGYLAKLQARGYAVSAPQ